MPRIAASNILEQHSDEVWHVRWSNDGQYLASAGKDRTAIIWRIGIATSRGERDCTVLRVIDEHTYSVGVLRWSPDDQMLLTSTDSTIKFWDAKTGNFIRALDEHHETVSSIEWLPDNSGFLSGGLDRKIWLWDCLSMKGEIWLAVAVRVTDLAIAPDGSRVVVMGMGVKPQAESSPSDLEKEAPGGVLLIYDYGTKKQEASIQLEGELTSVKISRDSRYALVNHAPDRVQLWDLETLQLVQKFVGQRQGRHVIRSCFGGVDGRLIVSGSEDGKVYVWQRDSGELLEVLSGHGEGSVNDVAWHPQNERLFASCSDDKTVRIWECSFTD